MTTGSPGGQLAPGTVSFQKTVAPEPPTPVTGSEEEPYPGPEEPPPQAARASQSTVRNRKTSARQSA